MSNSSDESNEPAESNERDRADADPSSDDPGYISDEQLPEDLRPDDDNPLAQEPEEGEEGEEES